MSQEARNRKRAEDRKKAKEFGAVDARELVATVPYLARLLSTKEIEQIQTLLDAAILNPMYKQQHRKSMRDSVISRTGNMVIRDERKVRKAGRRLANQAVIISGNPRFIRVNHHKMLTADALLPRTNNPDEADFLARIRLALNSKGVWLLLKNPGGDLSVWEFSFSVGDGRYPIETDDARIDQDELLRAMTRIESYLTAVMMGPVLTTIKQLNSRLDRQYDAGRSLHMDLSDMRDDTWGIVVKTSDWLGSANFPDMSIWDRPFKLHMKALDACTAGDVITAQAFLVFAAQAIEYNAELLADYAGATVKGGNTAVKILKVAKTAGQVAEVGLTLTGVGGLGIKVLKGSSRKALTTEARDKAVTQLANRYAKQQGISQAELMSVRYVRQPAGTVLGSGMKHGQSTGGGTGFHKFP